MQSFDVSPREPIRSVRHNWKLTQNKRVISVLLIFFESLTQSFTAQSILVFRKYFKGSLPKTENKRGFRTKGMRLGSRIDNELVQVYFRVMALVA